MYLSGKVNVDFKNMDADILAERILLDLKNTFKKDPLIDEFDVLPVHESHSNTCPVIHIEHKIALEDWCVKHVYVYAYSKFFSWRKKSYKADPDSLLMWTSAILLINPEIETVWNARKELVCQNLLLPENELKFSELVLSRKPKSSPVYAHRKWVLLEMQKRGSAPCSFNLDHELQLCGRFADLYPNNYYAWCHRSWVLKEMGLTNHQTISDELHRTEKWASVHVSDHCGLHYRQFLLSCLRNVPKDTTLAYDDSPTMRFNKALRKELDFLGGLQTIYPGHEALWYHRRYILHTIHTQNNEECKSLEFKIHSSYGNADECSNSAEFKVPASYGNADECNHSEEFKAPASFENSVDLMEGTAQFKRHKLECTSQELIDQDKILLKGSVHCKRHKLDLRGRWSVFEEEAFLRQLVGVSREGEWERTLIRRHVKWLSSTLNWSLSLS